MLPSRTTLVLGLTSAIPTFFTASWVFFLPLIFKQLGFSPVTIGTFYGVATLLSSAFSLIARKMILKLGPKEGLVLGGVIRSVSALMIYTFSPLFTPSGFIIDLGVGHPLSNTSRQYLIMKGDKQATNMGWFMTIAGLPAVFSPLLGAITGVDRLLILATSVTTFIATVTRALVLDEKKVEETPSMNFSSVFSAIVFTLFSLLVTVDSFIVPIFSQQVIGLTLSEVGLLYSIRVLGENSLAFYFGHLADRLGVMRVFTLAVVIGSVSMLLFSVSRGVSSIIAFLFWSLTSSMSIPSSQALFYQINKSNYVTAYSVFLLISGVLSLPSDLIVGSLFDVNPYLPFILQSLGNLIGLLVITRRVN
ncbi:MFS transporter [Stygiolobus caldivivus]|uniref:Major facilitator superfamily (MFS) profile domain-containing protein n=1 Tax=Stygiolobus caldivivus TaxID=2824673 RepID=A0A8D5ZJ50_9CREN|nr:MFS transporter [Stygiolobus caldivivus]BCU69857.1 hypothetical protein KN1_11540 [Stygiolobus caldivivus]